MFTLESRVRVSSVRAEVRQVRKDFHTELKALQAYSGGLLAERHSCQQRKYIAVQAARLAARRAWCSRVGRRIDLCGIMSEKRPDGKPLWALVDPTRRLFDGYGSRTSEGKFSGDGTISVGNTWVKLGAGHKFGALLPSGGIPPLPPVARKLATDKRIRRRARWVGLLYQPHEWTVAKPDPAIVCEWKDRPDEYYALCVWGADYPRIMEFVS